MVDARSSEWNWLGVHWSAYHTYRHYLFYSRTQEDDASSNTWYATNNLNLWWKTTPVQLLVYVVNEISWNVFRYYLTQEQLSDWGEASASHVWAIRQPPYMSTAYNHIQPISCEVTHTHNRILPILHNKALLAKCTPKVQQFCDRRRELPEFGVQKTTVIFI